MIVDAQVHVWEGIAPPPATGGRHVVHARTMDDGSLLARMDEAGIGRAILVPTAWERDGLGLAATAALARPDRFAFVGRPPLDRPIGDDGLRHWRDRPGCVGFRASFRYGDSLAAFLDGTVDWYWAAAERMGTPVMVFAPGAVSHLAVIARRHPDLRLAVDHMGLSLDERGADLTPAIDRLVALADFPNIAVKATALPAYVEEGYPFPSLHGHVRRVIDAFGPERVFWGSDLSRLDCAYGDVRALFEEALGLSDHDRRLVLGDGIVRWIGMPPTLPATVVHQVGADS